jgi:alkylhydroperoxidase family enzyme
MVQEDRRLLLKVATAIRFLAETNAALLAERPLAAGDNTKKHAAIGVNVEDRRAADFSDEEINEILRQAGMSAFVAAEGPA